MRRVNRSFRIVTAFLAFCILLVACQKQELQVDENGNVIQTDDSNSAQGEEGALSLYNINGDAITLLKDYNVKNKYKTFQSDKNKHQQMWDYFAKLIPQGDRRYIVEFEVIHGEGELLGYVTPIDDSDLSRWRMGLAIDQAGDLSKIDLATEFAYTSIHEYGHVLTLNHTQIDAAGASGSCGAFHLEEGCSNADSYINELYNIGWADIMGEFNKIKNDNQSYKFYEKYKDRFVTEYAASNPAEDIAEVFSVFVTAANAPTGNTIADQKVKAMYNYPELVTLRNEIRKNDVIRALKPGKWVRPRCKHGHGHQEAAH